MRVYYRNLGEIMKAPDEDFWRSVESAQQELESHWEAEKLALRRAQWKGRVVSAMLLCFVL